MLQAPCRAARSRHPAGAPWQGTCRARLRGWAPLCALAALACQGALGLDGISFGSGATGGAGGSRGPSGAAGAAGLDAYAGAGSGNGSGNGSGDGSGNGPRGGSGGNGELGIAGRPPLDDGGAPGSAGADGMAPVLGFDHYSFQRGPLGFDVAADVGLTRNDAPGTRVSSTGSIGTIRGGQALLAADGSFRYEPPSERFWGDDGFSYAAGASSAAVRVTVQPGLLELADVERGLGNGFAIAGTAAEDFAGSFVASAGDVNGDGRADVLVAAPHATQQAGAVYLVFGKSDTAPVSLDAIAAGNGTAGFAILGVAPNDSTGRQLAGGGDINGDGLDDILVGTAEGDRAPDDGTGIAYVVYGKADGAPVRLAELQAANAGLGFAIFGFDAGDSAGRNVTSAGDFNGDGRGDLIVGAQFADDRAGGQRAGAAYVVFGKSDTEPVELAQIENGADTLGVFFRAIAAMDFTGASVSGGDVNGDGLGDVIIGAHDGDLGGPDAGQVYVIFGRPAPRSMALDAIDGGFTIIGDVSSDAFGRTSAIAGDVNGDGLDEILIGAGAGDPHGATVYLVFGKASTGAVRIATFVEDGAGARLEGVELDDTIPGGSNFTGSPLARAGDIDGDGLGDVIIGAYGASFGGAALTGAAHVLLGSPGPRSLDMSELDGSPGSAGFTIRGVRARDLAGFSVAGGGDVDADGLADLIVGAPGAAGDSPGAVAYVLFGWDMQGALAERGVPLGAH